MRRLSALVVIVPLTVMVVLAVANLEVIHRLERPFNPSSVGGVYSFHPGAPVRSYILTKQPWVAPAASRLAKSRGSEMTLGVETQTGPFELWHVAQFQAVAHRDVDIVQYSRSWAQPFQSFLAQDVWRRGAIPLLTWEPWSYAAGRGPGGASLDQPFYSLKSIYRGRHDHYLRAYARAVRSFGHPILIRFAPEMNGDWNSWSVGVNGNKRGDYVRAWRHIHDVFKAQGAKNVLWVWAPNVLYRDSQPYSALYPGSGYVDVVALDGYNWGTVNSWNSWRSFSEIFGSSLAELKRIAPHKPVLISETASTELGGSKAAWIRDLFAGLRRHPEIIGFNWFDRVKETNWRVDSSQAAAGAFAAQAVDFPTSPAAKRFRTRIYELDRRLAPTRYVRVLKTTSDAALKSNLRSNPKSGRQGR